MKKVSSKDPLLRGISLLSPRVTKQCRVKSLPLGKSLHLGSWKIRSVRIHANYVQTADAQTYPLTVTPVTVTQYLAIWLQWHIPKFPIYQSYSKFQLATVKLYKPFAYSDTFDWFPRVSLQANMSVRLNLVSQKRYISQWGFYSIPVCTRTRLLLPKTAVFLSFQMNSFLRGHNPLSRLNIASA